MSGDGWRGPAWIPDESPGGLGAPEVWIDAHSLDCHSGLAPVTATVTAGNGGGPWIGRMLQFGHYPGAERDEITYMIVARRWDRDRNRGQPYYVAKIPDQGETT